MRIVNGIELDDGVDEPGAYEWHDSPDEYQPYHKQTPCKNNPMHTCDDGCATECRLWRQAKPTEAPALTESQQRALDTECGQFCTPDDHLRYADRGKCMLCGRDFNPPNSQADPPRSPSSVSCPYCNGWGIEPNDEFGACRNGCQQAPELEQIDAIIKDVVADLFSPPNPPDMPR